MPAQYKSLATRVLHLLLLIAVLHQLITSSLMEAPKPGAPGSPLFELHEAGGLASLGVVLLFWAWTAVRRRETTLTALFPWFSLTGLRLVSADLKLHLRTLAKLRLAQNAGALANAVHGLGLLTVTAMALTGAVSLILGPDLAKQVIEIHTATANLMWAYVIAHASLAVIHHLVGDPVLRQMFTLVNASQARRAERAR